MVNVILTKIYFFKKITDDGDGLRGHDNKLLKKVQTDVRKFVFSNTVINN